MLKKEVEIEEEEVGAVAGRTSAALSRDADRLLLHRWSLRRRKRRRAVDSSARLLASSETDSLSSCRDAPHCNEAHFVMSTAVPLPLYQTMIIKVRAMWKITEGKKKKDCSEPSSGYLVPVAKKFSGVYV